MPKPVVAVVGRPNVGKSTFFNYLVGKRISIVEDTPGVTRDRIYAEVEWRNKKFTLIDTGGIEPYSEDKIMQQMKRQAEIAIETADIIIFMVDVKDGVTASDKEVATLLRKTKKPVIVAVNKVDKIGELPADFYEFYNLGFGELMAISSIHGLGMGDLLDEIFKYFPEEDAEDYDEDVIKVAVVGKPNVGKSSLINRILGEERVIVSDIPGTTRDAIDTFVENEHGKFVFIDTAGIRRQSKINEKIEKYSIIRSWTAIERADVCLILIDAKEGVTEQDTKIAGYAHEQGKASIIVVNKWDLIEKQTGTLEEYRRTVHEKLGFMLYAPVIFISALTGQRVDRIYGLIKHVADQAAMRISTGVLNDLLNEATAMVQPPSDKGKRLKIYYMTQSSVKPPSFVLFINNMELMHYSYERYLENQLRKSFGFEGTPIKFILREKEKE
ncbi:MAG TPA: ribosome biogenesis GTPase Der [Hungateiclostridium thermocellum]|uniref:GTPase Der n=2 Tax=Acetivibrio thermocellus TaxID=1515 RepID=DER_ACET2|nr:ribosome biogenesis GTPase Der [Acetivibrio thermocellus]A3DE77.1 RecName: Full=GTPase Der; AltName: Full=GTP-binding protein EngA [Acetivibrio thermocellus ATCC 27405]CDG35718.1 GTPase Der [Acetivibrio thermocellus BC1]ABN52256.1 ribosome-associated GTPase EngA [Acetivibrio thermocellus ATCC 27405]ADU74254.1 ribosome-associated GTPase EngA [Acetivibrio thermocellus DSM 1313]ALX08197.1 GTP-binding protein engA [Acetivibrio thermocellus AD2]ANV75945.1 GTP-binding protein engA [Acetivibrio t